MPPRFRDIAVRYGIAASLILFVLALQALLQPVTGNQFAVALLFIGVVFAAWLGGFGPAAFVSFGGLLCIGLFFPNETETDDHPAGLLLYILITLGIALLGAKMRSANARAQKTARELGTILSSIGDAVLVTDDTGQVVSLNSMAERLTGWTSAEARGQPLDHVFDIHDERTGAPAASPVSRVLQEGTIVGLSNHTVLRTRAGKQTAIDDSAAPVRGPDGRITGVVMVFRDVSERRRTEEVRRRLAAIVESSTDAIIAQSLEGTITSWNAAAEQLYGYSAGEIIGQPFSILVPPDHAGEIDSFRESMRQGERIPAFESVRRRKDGSLVDVSISYSPIAGDDGTVIGAAVIARDISDRKRAEAALRESDRRKDEFLAMLAHELRNPLAPIRSGLDLLTLSGTPERETLGLMQEQVTHLVRLVDDLLDVSRIVRGRVELRTDDVRLDELVARVVDTVRPLAQSRNLSLSFEAPGPVCVIADRVRLTQVVDNLLSNAIKYTEPGGRIEVSVSREHDDALVRVRDNGIGIEPALLPRVFDLFTQSSRALDRAQGGLGIGLTLARKLIEMHGGSIEADSPGLGQGSTFTVRIPAVDAPVHDAPPIPEPTPSAAPRRILIVDDNAGAARILKLLLARLGDHLVHTVPDGPAALQAASEQRPDLILLDIGLPGMDGYAVCRALRAQADTRCILVAALTGYGQEEDLRRSEAAGFDEHIVKPVSVASLRELLNHPKLRSYNPDPTLTGNPKSTAPAS